MISLFDKELMQLEREVRDLKTIHKRGLGTVQFFTKTATYSLAAGQSVACTIILEDGEPTNPICLAAVKASEPLSNFSYTRLGVQRFNFWAPNAAQEIEATFICSSQIKEIRAVVND